MQKRFIVLTILTLLVLQLCGCGRSRDDSAPGEQFSIVTTVFPAYDFARQLSGNHADIILLVPPGSETHSYEPTPSDIIALQSADLVVCNGGESEIWLETLLEGIDYQPPVLRMMDCVQNLEEEIKEGMQQIPEDENEEKEYDEHVWTSPANAMEICEAITGHLISIDPENTDEYFSLLSSYLDKLSELDTAFRNVVETAEYRTLVFADRFPVRYFVEEYGLDYYAAFPGCADDAEPSAKTVAFLIDKVRDNHIPYVLYIEFSTEKMADVICEDTGCGKLLFHSCHNVSADEIDQNISYLQLMQSNLETVREALGSGCITM